MTWPQPHEALHVDVATCLSIAWELDARHSARGSAPMVDPSSAWSVDQAPTLRARPEEAGIGRDPDGGYPDAIDEVLLAMSRARRDARALFAGGHAVAARGAATRVAAAAARLCCVPARSRVEALAKADGLVAFARGLRSQDEAAATLASVAAHLQRERWLAP